MYKNKVTGKSQINLQVKDRYASLDKALNNEPATLMKLDDVQTEYPWDCISYASRNNLRKRKGWEWIQDYLDADTDLVQMIHTYCVLTLKQYKYGIELPRSYKHALELDC
jgi:hypothetical protein